MYPTKAEINGEIYEINSDFNTAFECFEVLEDETITDYERALAVVYLLFGIFPEENFELFLEKSKKFLQCGETLEEQTSKKKDMDLIQDKKYIVSSFMSDYHINLSEENIHFWYFIELLQGLTENSSLSRIRNIRNIDLSDITDPKEKEKIILAKKELELKEIKKATKEQQNNTKNFLEAIGIEVK